MKQEIKVKFRFIYYFGIFWTLLAFVISLFLFLEWRNYQDLTADLCEIQAVYDSYLLLAKPNSSSCVLEEEQKFVAVDRSEENLKNLLPQSQRASKRNNLVNRLSKQVATRTAIFAWPVMRDSFWISSFFGPRKLGRTVRMHAGIDLAAIKGTPVLAAASGQVITAAYEFGYGNTVVIEHNQKYKTRYAHLDEIFVRPGRVVRRGEKIGAVGDTGFVQAEGNSASHLHFEVYAFNKQVNPILYLPKL